MTSAIMFGFSQATVRVSLYFSDSCDCNFLLTTQYFFLIFPLFISAALELIWHLLIEISFNFSIHLFMQVMSTSQLFYNILPLGPSIPIQPCVVRDVVLQFLGTQASELSTSTQNCQGQQTPSSPCPGLVLIANTIKFSAHRIRTLLNQAKLFITIMFITHTQAGSY